MKKDFGEKYTPLYFLSSLAGGGLSVSFYMYLFFMIEHPKTPLATFDHIFPLLVKGDMVSFLIAFLLVFVIYFAYLHFKLLVWNIKEYGLFKKTESYQELKRSNAEVTLMALPLTYAMTINVCFVLGAVFIPGLWSIVEYLFPFAIAGFLGVGIYATRIFIEYFTRILTAGDFDFVSNSNLSQMIAIFAFSMVSVGFAAPGAMSHHVEVSAFGLFFSIFFAAISISLTIIKLILGFKSMLRYGIKPQASGTLWVMIPILTLLGIAFIRISFGLVHNFNQEPSSSMLFMLTSAVVSLQIIFGLIGYSVMKRVGYFDAFVHGDKTGPEVLVLICPGVAFFVFGMFFIFFGILKNNIVDIFSVAYFVILSPYVYVQIKTVFLYLKLNAKLLSE